MVPQPSWVPQRNCMWPSLRMKATLWAASCGMHQAAPTAALQSLVKPWLLRIGTTCMFALGCTCTYTTSEWGAGGEAVCMHS